MQITSIDKFKRYVAMSCLYLLLKAFLQYLQEYHPFDSYVSVFTLKYENWHHSYPYSPRTTGPFSVQLSALIRNIPKINNQDIAVFFQEYLGYHYM